MSENNSEGHWSLGKRARENIASVLPQNACRLVEEDRDGRITSILNVDEDSNYLCWHEKFQEMDSLVVRTSALEDSVTEVILEPTRPCIRKLG
jgi:hypothetical protein